MGRWQPDSRGRLEEAALTLFAERGFDETTAAQVAEAAGLSERTFFRHFADKREVLSGGSELLRKVIVEGVSAAPLSDSPLEAVGRGLQAVAGLIGEGRRDLARKRQSVVAANPELRERELAKLADFSEAVAEILRARGVPEPQATIAAESAPIVFRVALQRWANDPDDGPSLSDIMRSSLEQMRSLS